MILNTTDFEVDENSLGPPLDENDEKYLPEREKKFLEDLNKKSENETLENDEKAQRLVPIFGVEDSQNVTENGTNSSKNATEKENISGSNKNGEKVGNQDLTSTNDDESATDVKVDKNDDAMDSSNSGFKRIAPFAKAPVKKSKNRARNRGAINNPNYRSLNISPLLT